MQTDRFNELRKNTLKQIFNNANIISIWRNIVKDQMRGFDIKDLYDYYDFNYNIESRANSLRTELLSGNYKSTQPLIYRLEKKYGICRHIVIPQPSDALILQILVESIIDTNKEINIYERYIDLLNKLKVKPATNRVEKSLRIGFLKHLRDQSPKYWEKVLKRYITLFTKLNSKWLLKYIGNIYLDYPSVRQNLLFYMQRIGYTKKSSDIILKILADINIFDDISLFYLCELVTKWKIPATGNSQKFIDSFEKSLYRFNFTANKPIIFYCILWFKAKYNHPDDLISFINKFENLWQYNSFLRRQVTAILSRLYYTDSQIIIDIIRNQISSGIPNTVTLANQLIEFKRLKTLNFKLMSYLFPQSIQDPYPLSKYLVLCSVLNSKKFGRIRRYKIRLKNILKILIIESG